MRFELACVHDSLATTEAGEPTIQPNISGVTFEMDFNDGTLDQLLQRYLAPAVACLQNKVADAQENIDNVIHQCIIKKLLEP